MNTTTPCPTTNPRTAPAAALWSAVLIVSTLSAQTVTTTDNAVRLDKFEVTGSYLPQSADAPAIPVTTIDALEIERTGVTTNVLDVLRKTVPQFTGGRNLGDNNANIGGGSTNGGSQLSLRNLQTLVLINGRRAAFAPVSASGGYEFVDVNLIPVSAIERIEVLTDGASAIYGSDAISGVVNIILKTNYQGLEVGGHYGFSDNSGHWAERSGYVVGGVSNGTTSVTLSGEWSKSDPLFQYERNFSNPIYGTPTYAGVINVSSGSKYYRSDGKNYYLLNPNLTQPPSGHQDLNNLVSLGVYSGPYTSTEVQQFFNLANYVTLQQSNERKSATVSITHKLSPDLTAFGDLLYANTQTFYQLNAQPFSATLAATSAANPTDSAITARNRLVDYPRQYFNDTQSIRGVAGLKGTLAGDYSWEIAANHNEIRQNYTNKNLVDTNARTTAVNNGTLVLTATDQADGVAESILGTAYANYVSKLTTFDAVFRGKAFDLPAGPAQFAIAGQVQRESFSVTADRNSQADTFGWDSGTTLNPFDGGRTVKSVVLQFGVPIFGGEAALPYAHSLTTDIAVRRDYYSDTSDPTVPKYTLRWQPFDDHFTLRSTFSKSFTAPTLYELFGPVDIGFTSTQSLAAYDGNGVATGKTVSGQANLRSGSNSSLEPSKAENFTAGFVYSPKAVRGLSFTADYFHINQYSVVGTVGASTILADVEKLGTASAYASRVRIGKGGSSSSYFDGGTAITAPGQISAAGLDNVYVSDQNINLGGYKVDGVDLGVKYTRTVQGIGRFDFGNTTTVYNHYKIRTLADTPYTEYSNYVTANFSARPDWRSYTTLAYARDAFGFSIAHTYIPSTEDTNGLTPEDRHVESYTQFDLQASYAFGNDLAWLRGTKVTLGVDNVLNEFGPRSPSNTQSNVDIGTYGAVGRKFYVGLQHKF